jgi:glycosyltransferase involved in cell wall biosynthesis
MTSPRRSVLIIQEHLPHYRVPFFEQLRKDLSAHGVSLQLIFSPKTRESLLPGYLSWARPVPIHWFGSMGWQNVFPHVKGISLVIAPQETKYAVLPLLMILRKWGGWKFAFWGHGKNFQSIHPNSFSERWKRFISRRADWWFAYNNLSARVVRDLGFPASKITSVMNSIDTSALIQARNAVTPTQQTDLRKELGIFSKNIGIYTGGLYPQKRISFLLQACRIVRKKIPDFEMIVIGRGPDEALVVETAKREPWLHYLGAKDDAEKVPFWSLANVCLMPGLVGLALLDSFAFGVPMVTTAYPYHSPEIDYLSHGKTGLICDSWQDPIQYADTIVALLSDPNRLATMKTACQSEAVHYSIQKMSALFCNGVMNCIPDPKH